MGSLGVARIELDRSLEMARVELDRSEKAASRIRGILVGSLGVTRVGLDQSEKQVFCQVERFDCNQTRRFAPPLRWPTYGIGNSSLNPFQDVCRITVQPESLFERVRLAISAAYTQRSAGTTNRFRVDKR